MTVLTRKGRWSIALLVLGIGCLGAPGSLIADAHVSCSSPNWSYKRDHLYFYELIEACHALQDEQPSPLALATLGYMHRYGYGHIRDISAATIYYDQAMSLERCNRIAVCGIESVFGQSPPDDCDISCQSVPEDRAVATRPKSDEARAREILADLRSRSGMSKLAAQELESLFDSILTSKENRLSDVYQNLCLAHFKRALATISLGRQANREISRRKKLIEYHKKKVEEDNNARSQAALVDLSIVMENSEYEVGVFEDKYHQALIAASDCDTESLKAAYAEFSREIANVETSSEEESLFNEVKREVETFRRDKSINTTEYRRLTTTDG